MIGCLIIHGYTGGPHEVELLADYLRAETNWEVFVPTLPGHGKELALDNASHEEWIEAAEKALFRLQAIYETLYVIGFSMGGMIAAYLAGKYDVKKLVLLAPAGKIISLKRMSYEIGEIIIDGLTGKIDENKMYLRYRNKAGNIPFKANIELVKLVKLTRNYLKDIKIPVFIAQGKLDPLVPAKTIYYLDKEIASDEVEVVLFDQSDHLLCLGNDKDTLNQMVLSFLQKNNKGTN